MKEKAHEVINQSGDNNQISLMSLSMSATDINQSKINPELIQTSMISNSCDQTPLDFFLSPSDDGHKDE